MGVQGADEEHEAVGRGLRRLKIHTASPLAWTGNDSEAELGRKGGGR